MNKITLDDVGRQFFLRFFAVIVASKMYHYRTKKYSTHKTIDDFFEKFIELSDKFLETWQGAWGKRIIFPADSVAMEIPVITDNNWRTILTQEANYLNNVLPRYERSSDLLNIRDELLNLIHQTEYLLTFS